MENKYFLFAEVAIKGYFQTVVITKNGKIKPKNKVSTKSVMLFDSVASAFEYAKQNSYDIVETEKIENFLQ